MGYSVIKRPYFLTIVCWSMWSFCWAETPTMPPALDGDNIEIIRSEKGIVKYKMYAPKALGDRDGNMTFPQGIEVTFYDQDEKGQKIVVATLRAHSAAIKNKSQYAFQGDVEIKSYKNNVQANTEAFYWDQGSKKLYTDTFVRIQKGKKGTEVLMCQGLIANQDFSEYEFIQPEGFFQAKSMQHAVSKNSQKVKDKS